jgi:hypothetical protein
MDLSADLRLSRAHHHLLPIFFVDFVDLRRAYLLIVPFALRVFFVLFSWRLIEVALFELCRHILVIFRFSLLALRRYV